MERPDYKPIARVFVQSIFFSPSFRNKTLHGTASFRKQDNRELPFGRGVLDEAEFAG